MHRWARRALSVNIGVAARGSDPTVKRIGNLWIGQVRDMHPLLCKCPSGRAGAEQCGDRRRRVDNDQRSARPASTSATMDAESTSRSGRLQSSDGLARVIHAARRFLELPHGYSHGRHRYRVTGGQPFKEGSAQMGATVA